jgi:HEPN domain-containing protein
MANGKELKQISISRLKAAKILIENKDYDGAVYIMGYALECALKSAICKLLNLSSYPDKGGSRDIENIFKTHRFDVLLILSGMSNDFNLNTAPRRYENWSELTKKWSTEIRYEPIGSRTETEASRMYLALLEKEHGIITWINKEKKW